MKEKLYCLKYSALRSYKVPTKKLLHFLLFMFPLYGTGIYRAQRVQGSNASVKLLKLKKCAYTLLTYESTRTFYQDGKL